MVRAHGTAGLQWFSPWSRVAVWENRLASGLTNPPLLRTWHPISASVCPTILLLILSSTFEEQLIEHDFFFFLVGVREERKTRITVNVWWLRSPCVLTVDDLPVDNLVEGKRRRRGNGTGPGTPNSSATNSPRTPAKRKLTSSTEDERTPAKRGRRGGGARSGMGAVHKPDRD